MLRMAADHDSIPDRLRPGTRVEVRNTFDGSWARGFTVVDADETSYRISRRYDGVELPARIPAEDVRRERRNSMWWV